MDRSRKAQEATLQERVTFLQDLHRPLEEHWSYGVPTGLNARTSDYNYKHHITHLEDIYLNHKFVVPAPSHNILMSPVTQLYGINGLKSSLPTQREKEKEREGKWVANFQVHTSLDPPKQQKRMRHKDTQSHQRTVSPDNGDTSGQFGQQTMPLEMTEEELEAEKKLATKRRTLNEGLTSDELVLLGMYRFNPEQEEVYKKFVEMLAGFDKFDMKCILEDAYEDAQSDDMLRDFGGIDTGDKNKH